MMINRANRPVHVAVLGALTVTAIGAALVVPSFFDDEPGQALPMRQAAAEAPAADPEPPTSPAADEGAPDAPAPTPVAVDPAVATPDPAPPVAGPPPDEGSPADAPEGDAPGTDLPDGRHFGQLSAAYVAPAELVFDLQELLTGAEAQEAAREDGVPAEDVHDFYIRDVNPRLRSLPVSGDVVVTLVDCGGAGCVEGAPASYDALTRMLEADASTSWWLTIEAGEVVRIDQQYLP